MNTEEILKHLQTEVAARLRNAPGIGGRGIPVIAFREGDLESEMEHALMGLESEGGRQGAAVNVLAPRAESASADAPGPELEAVLTIECLERPLLNAAPGTGFGVSADGLAVLCLVALHHYAPAGLACGVLYAQPGRAIDPLGTADDGSLISYTATLRAPIDAPRQGKVGGVAIAITDGSATLSCATAGSSIWYAIAPATPAPGEPGAQLYGGVAVPVPPGAIIRACGYKATMLPGDTAAAENPS